MWHCRTVPKAVPRHSPGGFVDARPLKRLHALCLRPGCSGGSMGFTGAIVNGRPVPPLQAAPCFPRRAVLQRRTRRGGLGREVGLVAGGTASRRSRWRAAKRSSRLPARLSNWHPLRDQISCDCSAVRLTRATVRLRTQFATWRWCGRAAEKLRGTGAPQNLSPPAHPV